MVLPQSLKTFQDSESEITFLLSPMHPAVRILPKLLLQSLNCCRLKVQLRIFRATESLTVPLNCKLPEEHPITPFHGQVLRDLFPPTRIFQICLPDHTPLRLPTKMVVYRWHFLRLLSRI